MNFDEIYEKYFGRVYKFIRVKTLNSEESEDIAVKVFENVYRNIDRFCEEKGSMDVWIFSIARNEINSYYRSKNIQAISMDSIGEISDNSNSPEDILNKKIENKRLQQALEILNENERFVISCKYAAGLKNKEIGKLMGISSSNVGVVLFRSMKKLKKQLACDFENKNEDWRDRYEQV